MSLSRSVASLVVLALVLGAAGTTATAVPTEAANETAASVDGDVRIAAVYPDPVAHGDAGEFVVLTAPETTALTNATVADRHRTASVPTLTVDGRVVLSTRPDRTRNLTRDEPVRPLDGGVRLANDGDRVELRRNGTVVDAVTYADPREGELGVVTADGVAWRPLGATSFPVVAGDGGEVRTFVLPDGASAPVDALRRAEDRILLAGYTLTSERVADELVAAAERGATVRVLVEGGPVGGLTRRQAAVLDRLAAENVTVRVLGGDHARYRYHHAKYAVVDDRALVTTENWKPSGTGGRASRGWGVVVEQRTVVTALAETFAADNGWHDGVRWERFRDGRRFEPAQRPPANGSYRTRHPPARHGVDRVELVRAPDNAEERVVELLDGATQSVRIQQVSIGGRNQPFLQSSLDAARRGVEVRILLSDAWYVRDENEALVAWLNERAAAEDIPLEARLATPRGRYEKVHTKGVVVDGERALVGSLNWNNNSARNNREVAVLLHGESAAGYYATVFDADWRGGVWTLPVGLVAAAVVAVVVAITLARRIHIDGDAGGAGGRFRV